MSAGSFRSVFMVASCAAAALGCYMVSLRVASERAALEQVETRIVLAKRDIRVLQTEIGTRGRLAQLERWNVNVLRLSAPSADQFLGGGFELARLVQPKRQIDIEAPVVLAAAPGDAARPQVQRVPGADEAPDLSAKALMQTVSLKREVPADPPATPRSVKSAAPYEKPASEKAKPETRAQASEKAKPDVKGAAEKAKPEARAQAGDKAKPAAGAQTGAKAKPEARGPADKAKPEAKAPAAEKGSSAGIDPLAPLATPAAKPKKIAASATAKEPTKTP